MVLNAQQNPGLAFGAFKCSDPRPPQAVLSRLKGALENIKLAHEETKVPQDIDFFVMELRPILATLSMNGAEAELVGRMQAVEMDGANFFIQASLPGSTNLRTADELGFAFNCLYGGTELFDAENEGRSKLVMEVFFRHDITGAYVSKSEIDYQ